MHVGTWDQRSMVAILVIINVVLFAANLLFTNRNNLITYTLGMRAGNFTEPLQWYRFLTYGFAHDPSRIMHIIMNMFSLVMIGRAIEERYGRWEFLRFYLITIVLGGVVWSLLHRSGTDWAVGASGGVIGVVMLFILNYPNQQMMFFGVFPLPAWVMGVLLIALNFLGSPSPTGGKVAYDIHLVGIACAAIYFYGQLNFGAIGEWSNQLKMSWKRKTSGLKVHRPESSEAVDETEADRILAKIHEHGQDSLSKSERKFMEKYSRQVRQRRSKTD